tara:strand:+ start:538 stop:1044 length:507 start_codon:yes stop_codon:yes gene_type:complete
MKIAIHGPMGSGKTTIANIIKENNPDYEIFSYGQKIKDIAKDVFKMKYKDRSLLIKIANQFKEIDQDIWAKYIMNQTNNKKHCIIDDLRFQNELDLLSDEWMIISLTTPKDVRIQRIIQCNPHNYKDHIKNMNDISETSCLNLPENTIYINTNISYELLKETILQSIQ